MIFKYSYYMILVLLVFGSQPCFASGKQLIINDKMQYGYAQTLFSAKDYETAMVEFKRFIHFFPESKQIEQAQFNIGVCLFNLKKYYDAAKAFNSIIVKDKENDITKQAVFFQTESFMKMGNTGYAQIVLQNYLKLVEDKQTIDKIYFNLAKIQLAEAKNSKPGALTQAENYLSKISDAGAIQYNIAQYNDLILKAKHIPKKNPTTAGLFAIIPGGGFLYCERYHDAFVTFLLNAGLMIAAYQAYENDNEALAGVIGFVETGFYTGNIYGSISSAHKYNQAQILKILNKDFSITAKFDLYKKSYEVSFNYEF